MSNKDYLKYMHLERFNTREVEGIEVGTTYVFPKLDGTNAHTWQGDNGHIKAGSRNRELTLDNDNAGFFNWVVEQENLIRFHSDHPHLHLFGEWLVPHTLKTYRKDAWRKFYVFDVFNITTGSYLHYDDYKKILDAYGIDYLAPLAIVRNGNYDTYLGCCERNVFLIEDGQGVGEGVVIKNYDFVNDFGRVVWAKVITNTFKEEHHKEMGAPEIGGLSTEQRIASEYVTQHLVYKVHAKIAVEHDGWNSKMIPQLLGMVWYDLITEEVWDILKTHKNPTIDFKALQRLVIGEVKRAKPDLF